MRKRLAKHVFQLRIELPKRLRRGVVTGKRTSWTHSALTSESISSGMRVLFQAICAV